MRYRIDDVRMQIDRMRPRLEEAKTWAPRLAGRFRSLSRGKKAGIIATAIGLLAVAVAASGGGGEIEPQAAPEIASLRPTAGTHDEIWPKVARRLNQANQEVYDSFKERLTALANFIERRKTNSRAFAEEILGLGGKFRATWAIGEAVFGAIGEALGGGAAGPDSFTTHIRDCFARHFFSAEEIQREIDGLLSGIAADVAAAESRMLVDLRTDLEISGVSLPQMRVGASFARAVSSAIDDIADVAARDYVASIGKTVISNVAGAIIERQVAREDAGTGERLLTSIAIGRGVDAAIDAAANRSGYDPESSMATKLSASLDRIKTQIFSGDGTTIANFRDLRDNQIAHPDPRVRAASAEATRASLASSRLGIISRLDAALDDRMMLRGDAVHQALFGSPIPYAWPRQDYIPGDPDAAIDFARRSLDYYRSN